MPNQHRHHHHHLHPQEGEQGPVCAKPGYHEVVHKHPRGQVPKINFNEQILDSINCIDRLFIVGKILVS